MKESAQKRAIGVAPWLLSAAVAAAPLPFGSTQLVTVAFWCVVLGACLVFAPVRFLTRAQLALAAVAGVVVVAYGLVLHEQLAVRHWLPGASSNPIWQQARAALGVPLIGSISIARNQPWFELGRPLVCILALSCGFLVGADTGRARQILNVIAWSGAVYAAFGILAHIFDPTHILWRDKYAYLNSVTGTFINRNTAGAYFGSCALVWSLLLWEAIQQRLPRGAALTWSSVNPYLAKPTKAIIVAFLVLFLCLAAMFMTLSRGAAVLSLLALVVGFVLFFRPRLPRRAALVTTLAGGGAAAFVLLEVMGAGVNARFDSQGFTSGGRLETYKATLHLIRDHPWFGSGQGTFASAFPAYRSADASIWGMWDIAHNTLLEIAADMGVPIAVLVIIGWAAIFATLVHGVIARRRRVIFPVAALTIALVAVLHSLVDFSLQIPGYSIVALALVGAGLAQSFGRDPPRRRAPELVPEPALDIVDHSDAHHSGQRGAVRPASRMAIKSMT
jgi:O-antigen ligase